MPQVDIITGEARRRIWTAEEKQAVLAAAFAPGAVVRAVARRVNVSTGQLYTWRNQLMKKSPDGPDGFSQVVAVADSACRTPDQVRKTTDLSCRSSVATARPLPAAPVSASACELPVIELEIHGHKVRIPPAMPAALASAVVRALVRRR
jgi:transposase